MKAQELAAVIESRISGELRKEERESLFALVYAEAYGEVIKYPNRFLCCGWESIEEFVDSIIHDEVEASWLQPTEDELEEQRREAWFYEYK